MSIPISQLFFRFTSENYQVMNYGVGGYISFHQDEFPLPFRAAFNKGGGGFRYTFI